jgi:hypothetical protein
MSKKSNEGEKSGAGEGLWNLLKERNIQPLFGFGNFRRKGRKKRKEKSTFCLQSI